MVAYTIPGKTNTLVFLVTDYRQRRQRWFIPSNKMTKAPIFLATN